jgi:hypothetical protein
MAHNFFVVPSVLFLLLFFYARPNPCPNVFYLMCVCPSGRPSDTKASLFIFWAAGLPAPPRLCCKQKNTWFANCTFLIKFMRQFEFVLVVYQIHVYTEQVRNKVDSDSSFIVDSGLLSLNDRKIPAFVRARARSRLALAATAPLLLTRRESPYLWRACCKKKERWHNNRLVGRHATGRRQAASVPGDI